MIDRQGASSISSTSGTRQKQQLQVSQTYSLQIRRTDNFKILATIRKKKNNTYPRLGCEAKLHDSPSRTPISTSLKGLTPPSPMSPLQTTLVKKQLRTREYVMSEKIENNSYSGVKKSHIHDTNTWGSRKLRQPS